MFVACRTFDQKYYTEGTSTSAGGASEENMESRHNNLVKKLLNCCEDTCISRLCSWWSLQNFPLLPRFPPKIIHGNFASAEGASEENWESRQRTWTKRFKIAVQVLVFLDCINRTGSRKVLCCASRHKQTSVISRASKARAKKVWNLYKSIWSKSFKIAVKLGEFEDCTNLRLANICFFPRFLPTTIVDNFASTKGTRRNLEPRQQF